MEKKEDRTPNKEQIKCVVSGGRVGKMGSAADDSEMSGCRYLRKMYCLLLWDTYVGAQYFQKEMEKAKNSNQE